MVARLLGEVDVELTLDENTGHRDYDLTWLIETDNRWTGPYSVMHCPGLPQPGDAWSFGPYGAQNYEVDPFAYCQGYMKVRPRKVKEGPVFHWEVLQKFSTRPFERPNGVDYEYTTPFAEFPRCKGSFVKTTEEKHRDRFGKLICNSSFDRFSGKLAEFPVSKPQVVVSLIWSSLGEQLVAPYVDCVNDRYLWGFPPRMVLLSNVGWERLVMRVDTWIYVVTLEFDIDMRFNVDATGLDDLFRSGHDRELVNISEKVLIPGGNLNNPTHFKPYRTLPDREKSKIILNLDGTLWQPTTPEEANHPPTWRFEVAEEANFFQLGIPAEI